MPGALALLIAMLVVLPSALFAAGALWSALLGASLNSSISGEEEQAGNTGN